MNPSHEYLLLLGIVAFIIILLIDIAAKVVSIYRNTRAASRQPPLTEELYRDFATKRELEALRQEILKQLKSGEVLFRDLERVVGRLEGALDRCPMFCAPVLPSRHPSIRQETGG